MIHRERALAAIRHELPDRVPINWITLENADSVYNHIGLDKSIKIDEYFGSDFKYVMSSPKLSLFGNSGSQIPYGQQLHTRPFAGFESVQEIEKFNWPELDSIDFDAFKSKLEPVHKEYAVIVGNWTSVFCEICDFFGMENALVNMYTNPELIEAAVAHIEDFYLKYCKKLFEVSKGKADIFHMWDDFASMRGMIFSPDIWRKYFKPVYKKMFELAKSNGLYVWFHSCGVIREVLPDLIDIGMDIWETVQAHLPGNEPEILKKEYGKHITFCGAINTQHTLPFGTPEEVSAEVRERIKILGRGGGYICNADHVIKRETPPENIIALYDEIGHFHYEGCTL